MTKDCLLAYGSELNQVWTSLIDNAIDAMEGRERFGYTFQEGDRIVVEITTMDQSICQSCNRGSFLTVLYHQRYGPRDRLRIGHRIVVGRHKGDIASHPGDTHFQVRLPINPTKTT